MEAREYELMDVVEERMWWYRALHARLIAALAPTAGRVLDAGCGTGGLLARLQAIRPELELVGLEFALPAAARAAEKSRAPIVRGTVNALPFADGSFGAAVLADVLCHAAVDPIAALTECARVLRPGGRLVVNMPAFAWLLSAHDSCVHNVRRQSAQELRTLLARAGFTAIRARYWNGLLLPLMIARRKLWARHRSDVAPFPPWLNATLHAVSALEDRLPVLPAGGSVLATATRP